MGEIKNIGNGDAGEFYVYWYIDDGLIDRGYANALDAGEVSVCGMNGIADKCGDIQVKAVIDGANAVDESNENNNVRIETINIDCVYLEKIWISGPDSIYVGETKEWKAFGLYSDGSQRELTYDVSWGSRYTLLDSVDFNKFKGIKEGEATLKIIYGEKSASEKITIIGKPEEKADLAIQSITWEPENPKEGDRITFYVKAKNQGSGAAGAFDVSFSFVDGSYKDCNSVSMLSAGSTSIQTFTWTANKCGYIFISAKADVNNAIPESNEGNNEEKRYLSVSCEKPDFTISAIKWSPSNPKEGDTITFDIDITNKGLGSAGNTYVIYYIDGSTIDYDFIPPLSAGSTSTQTFTWPANKCGDIKVTAIVDRDKIVTENDEANNERTETVNIICLYLEKIWITGPDEIKAGETLQWQAYGSYSDGSQKELTRQVSWTVDASDVLQNTGNGKFKGLKGGEATLKITYEGKSASKKVTVIEKKNQPPKASFTYEKDGLTVRFTSTSSDPDGDIETYSWFFRDGDTSNQKNPTHTYSSEGTYTVVLLVRDDKGAGDTYYENVKVTEPKLPVVIWVKNVNNQPLPECGGEITVKAYKELGDIFDDIFENKHVAEKTKSYNEGDSISVKLLVPKDAKFIRVWQKHNIEDGIKECWGSAEISPPGVIFFTRHTPWLYDIDFDLRSPYTQYINMDVNKEKHVDTTISNPGSLDKKVRVRLILDRDMKLDKDMKYDFDDIGPKDGFEVSSGETDFLTFRYTPREEGIWKFRAVVQTLYDDKYWVVTDQHAWYLIVGKKQIMRARSLQYVADYYIGNYIGIMSQEGEEVFQDRMAQAWANYSKDIGEILKETAISYDPVAGGLIGVFLDGGGGNSVEKGVKTLLDFSQAGLDAWSERFILNKAKDCNICSKLDKLKKLAIEEEDCWKSGDKDINKINHVLIEEGKQLAYVQGFTYEFSNNGSIYLPDIPGDLLGLKKGRIKKEMDKICQDMRDERKYAADTYCELNGGDEFDQYRDYLDGTSGCWNEGSDCAQGI